MFFKDFTNNRKEINFSRIFSRRSLPTISNTDETFQQSGKQVSLKCIMKRSGNMNESLGSLLFRSTTGAKSLPEAFDESRSVITFLTNLGVIRT